MTQIEYITKRDRIAISDAPIEVREQAMQVLNDIYFVSDAVETARAQLEESQADTNDIGNES